MIDRTDLAHLERCVSLAEQALAAGDQPFGSVLVGGDGDVLREARNHAVSIDRTRHPEFELARWAGARLSLAERRAATVYTSGEHCPMCAAAHGFVGLGRIVYATSREQLESWHRQLGVHGGRVRGFAIGEIVPGLTVDGPAPELAAAVHELHRRFHAAGKT